MDLANNIIGYLSNVVVSGENEEIETFLSLINFDSLEYSQAIKLLIYLLKMCQRYDNFEAAKIIYSKHTLFYDNDSSIQFPTVLFLNRETDVPLMRFITLRVSPGSTSMGTIKELIDITADYNSSEMRIAFKKVIDTFPTLELSALKDLHRFAKNQNDAISDELLNLIRKVNDFADIPDWMINTGVLPKESQVVASLPEESKITEPLNTPDPEDLIDAMLDAITEELEERLDCTDIDLVRDTLLGQYNALSLAQKYNFAAQFIERKNMVAMGQDATLFITLGPSAPLLNAPIEKLDYGGARMFTYNDAEYSEDVDDFELDDNIRAPEVEWFVGYCQQCNLRIRRRWHAVRVPLRRGGWQGCMCSWKCAKDSIVTFDRSDPVMLTLCDIYEKELYVYGIIDRIPDEDYDQYIADIANLNKNLITSGNDEIPLETTAEETEGTSIEQIKSAIKPIVVDMGNRDISPVSIVFFYADDCEVCAAFEPQLNQLVEYTTYQGGVKPLINLVKINANETDTSAYQVEEVPTVFVYQNSKLIQIFVGNQIRPILDLILSMGYA